MNSGPLILHPAVPRQGPGRYSTQASFISSLGPRTGIIHRTLFYPPICRTSRPEKPPRIAELRTVFVKYSYLYLMHHKRLHPARASFVHKIPYPASREMKRHCPWPSSHWSRKPWNQMLCGATSCSCQVVSSPFSNLPYMGNPVPRCMVGSCMQLYRVAHWDNSKYLTAVTSNHGYGTRVGVCRGSARGGRDRDDA